MEALKREYAKLGNNEVAKSSPDQNPTSFTQHTKNIIAHDEGDQWITSNQKRPIHISNDTEVGILWGRDRRSQQDQDVRRENITKRALELALRTTDLSRPLFSSDGKDSDEWTEPAPENEKSFGNVPVYDPSKAMGRIVSKSHDRNHPRAIESSSQVVSVDEVLKRWNGDRHEVPVVSRAATHHKFKDDLKPRSFDGSSHARQQASLSSGSRMPKGLFGPTSKLSQNQAGDQDRDDKNESEEHMFQNIVDTEIVVASYEGFKTHIKQLNPNMDLSHDWLVTRIAHQQEIRFRNLSDLKIQHSSAINAGKCPTAKHCLGMNRTNDYFDFEKSLHASNIPANVHGITNQDGEVAEEVYPFGIPIPPNKRYPAEFECQICFKVKKFKAPSVSQIFILPYVGLK